MSVDLSQDLLRQSAGFAGWTLSVGVPARSLSLPRDGSDLDASAETFVKLLRETLEQTFPEAALTVGIYHPDTPAGQEPFICSMGVDAPDDADGDRWTAVLGLLNYVVRAIRDNEAAWLVPA